jgi:nucleoid DNA-binding protein
MNTTEWKNAVYLRLKPLIDPPLTQEDVGMILDVGVDELAGGILKDGRASVRGFGVWRRTQRKGRTYSVRGKQVDIPNRDTVTFKPGTELVRAVKDPGE